MARFHTADGFRRLVAGASLVVAPLLLWGGVVTAAVAGGAELWAGTRQHPDLTRAATLLWLAGNAGLLPAALGLAHLLRRRAAWWGNAGAALMFMGCTCAVVLHAFNLVAVEMVHGGLSEAAFREMDRALSSSALQAPLNAGFFFGIGGGLLVLTVGCWTSRAVPRGSVLFVWALLLAVFGPMMDVQSRVLAVIVFAFPVIGMGWMGVHVLRMGDAEWAECAQPTAPIPVLPAERGRRPAGVR
jgi:hypothetical protein